MHRQTPGQFAYSETGDSGQRLSTREMPILRVNVCVPHPKPMGLHEKIRARVKTFPQGSALCSPLSVVQTNWTEVIQGKAVLFRGSERTSCHMSKRWPHCRQSAAPTPLSPQKPTQHPKHETRIMRARRFDKARAFRYADWEGDSDLPQITQENAGSMDGQDFTKHSRSLLTFLFNLGSMKSILAPLRD